MEIITTNTFYALKFAGKKAIIDWCVTNGLISSSYECPTCHNEMRLIERKDKMDGYEFVCRVYSGSNPHHIKRSIRKGTWFSESHLPILTILHFTYLWVCKSDAAFIMRETGINSSRTIVDWSNFCREICMDLWERENTQIGGKGTIVEIDESKFGKRKYNRGKRVNGKWVFGGVERGTNNCFFEVVENRSKEVLLECIKRNIYPGTMIITDGWKAYERLSEEGYNHLTVNHSITFKNKDTGAHTNTIEGLWGTIKREFARQGHRNSDHFDSYFAEFMWRRKYKNEEDLFPSFLQAIKTIYPPFSCDLEE